MGFRLWVLDSCFNFCVDFYVGADLAARLRPQIATSDHNPDQGRSAWASHNGDVSTYQRCPDRRAIDWPGHAAGGWRGLGLRSGLGALALAIWPVYFDLNALT